MLNLKKLLKNYDDSARAFSEFVPWMAMISPSVIVNKDGSLLAAYTLSGVDAEGATQVEIDHASRIAEHAMRSFDERFTVYWQVDRRRSDFFTGGGFEDAVSQMVNDLWRNAVVDSGQYINRHYFSVVYSPPGGMDGFFETVSHYMKREGHSLREALIRTTKQRVLKKAAFNYETEQLETYLADFLNKLASFEATVADIGLCSMKNEDLLGFLHKRASPATELERVNIPRTPAYLDALLPSDLLVSRDDTLLFRGKVDKFVAAASIKDWPDFTQPGLLDSLLSVPGELTISQIMRISSYDKTRKFLQSAERHHRNMSKSMATYAMEAMSKTESNKVDTGRLLMANDAQNALTAMTTEGRAYGHYNLTVLAYGSSALEADNTIKIVQRVLDQTQYISVREIMHLMSSFAGTLPGQAGALVRWSFVSTANLADIAPLRTLHAGKKSNEYFTSQYSTPAHPVPSLTVLPTEYSTPFYFNFHVGDLPHALVIGPSRTGKSTFNNLLISQWQKYKPNTIIFDKDYSCRIPTLLQGGQHIDLLGDHGMLVKLNPVSMIREGEEGRRAFARWVEILITSRGYVITAQDDIEIAKAIEVLADSSPEYHQLIGFKNKLPTRLSEQLEKWVGDGANAKFFDNAEDTFTLSRFTCIEMNRLFDDPPVARAFLEYAFNRVTKMLDGRPGLIYIEEAWFMLAEKQFSRRINDWLRTLAKKNTLLILATQSLDEVAKSDIFATLIDNIPNKIFLPNASALAHADMYRDQFGLNSAQIDRIRTAIPKRNYYIVTPNMSRMVDVRLPDEILAVVRSDAKAQKVFSRHYSADGSDWKQAYLKEMVYGEV